MTRIFFINSSSYLIYLLPLTLLTGPFIPDLIISVVGIVFIILTVIRKEWFYYKNIYSILFFLFYFYLVIRSLFSSDILLSLESSLFYFRFGIFSLAIWFLINNNKNFIKRFSQLLLVVFIYCLIDGSYQYFFSNNLIGIENNRVRMNLPFSDELILGGYLARVFPLLLGLVILNYHLNTSLIYVAAVLLIITDVLIYVTGERSAIFLLTCSTVYIILFIDKYKKLRIFTFILSLLLILIVTAFDDSIRHRNIDFTIEQMSSTEKQITSEVLSENSYNPKIEKDLDEFIYFSKEHNAYIRTAINMFKDNIWFGQGAKLFRKNCSNSKFAYNQSSCSTHPHHTYFQLLGETGLIGLMFFLSFISIIFYLTVKHMILKISHKKTFLTDYQICLIGCFIIIFNPFTPSLNFFSNWINIIHFLPVGFYLHSVYGEKI